MIVRLNNIRLFARHGVMTDEQTIGAWFRVSLAATTSAQGAIESDNIEQTVNYAQMADVVKREMEVPSKLIEHVAGRIGKRILSEIPSIEQLTVTVIKENPPISMECESASVEITISRQ